MSAPFVKFRDRYHRVALAMHIESTQMPKPVQVVVVAFQLHAKTPAWIRSISSEQRLINQVVKYHKSLQSFPESCYKIQQYPTNCNFNWVADMLKGDGIFKIKGAVKTT